jgi:hypothetical protein
MVRFLRLKPKNPRARTCDQELEPDWLRRLKKATAAMLQGSKIATFEKLIRLRHGADPTVAAFSHHMVIKKASGRKR